MDRRNFLKQTTGAGGAIAAAGLFGNHSEALETNLGLQRAGPQPNILFILVDELRYPRVFPEGVSDAGQFLRRFMPNTYALWRRGVKFAGHYSASTACTPARGTLVNGLYSQQNWLLLTILDTGPGFSATHSQTRVSDLRQAAARSRLSDALYRQVAHLCPWERAGPAGGIRL
jgi:Sulfatase